MCLKALGCYHSFFDGSTITEEDGLNGFSLNLGGIFHPCNESKRGYPSFEFKPDDDLSEEDDFVPWKGYKKGQKSKFVVVINMFARGGI